MSQWKAGLPSIDFYSLPDHNSIQKKKSNGKLKTSLLAVWIVLLALWFQSAFKIGTPLLSPGLIVYLILRSVLIVLTWYFLISPIIIFFLKKWLAEEKIKSHAPISEILKLIPATRLLLQQSWEFSKDKRGISRVGKFMTSVFIYSLVEDGQ